MKNGVYSNCELCGNRTRGGNKICFLCSQNQKTEKEIENRDDHFCAYMANGLKCRAPATRALNNCASVNAKWYCADHAKLLNSGGNSQQGEAIIHFAKPLVRCVGYCTYCGEMIEVKLSEHCHHCGKKLSLHPREFQYAKELREVYLRISR